MGNICNVEPLQAQGTVVVDSAQSISSENPLQNKVVTVEKANASALCVDLSGNPITFNADSQAVQKLQVALEPIQDLHGYANPWVGGAGKNKAVSCTLAELKTLNTSGTWSDNSYTVSGITFTCYFGADGLLTYVTESGTASAQAVLVLKSFTGLNGNYLFNGGISRNKYITIKKNGSWSGIDADGSADKSASFVSTDTIQLVIAVNASQTGTGIYYPMLRLATESDATFAPYSNECPISGRTETGVVTNGKNLYNKNGSGDGYVGNGYLYSNGNEVYSTSWTISEYIRVKSNTSLTISGNRGNDPSICYYDENKNYISGTNYGGLTAVTVTTPNNACYVRISVANDKKDTTMLEEGNTATAFEPYKTSNTASLSFGQTVYGCKVDFKTGKVTVTHYITDLGNVSYTAGALGTGTLFYTNYNPSLKNYASTEKADAYCSCMPIETMNNVNGGTKEGLSIGPDTSRIRIFSATAYKDMTAAQFQTAVTGQKLVYELATPIELQLTPSELQLLQGYNYITADGNINISLVPENVIDYVIGQIISAMGTDESGRTTASRAYSINEFFYKDGAVFKVTASIASGAAFTVGTNCTQTTIFAVLTALLNA